MRRENLRKRTLIGLNKFVIELYHEEMAGEQRLHTVDDGQWILDGTELKIRGQTVETKLSRH